MEMKTYKIGDLYTVSNGLSKGKAFFGQGYPFLTFSEVMNNFFIPETLQSLVQTEDKERVRFSIKRGDIFLNRTSETADELGISCVALKDYPNATFNGFCKRLRPISEDVVPEYIGYYLRTNAFRKHMSALTGSMITRASLRNEQLLSIEIELPSKEIQLKVADILRQYDLMIDNCKKQIALLEEAAQRLYREWFVDLRFPGYETTPIGENGLPEGWQKTTLESIATFINGFAFKPKHWHDFGLPIIKIKELKDGVSDSTPRYPGNDIPQKYHISPGDIIFSWSATLTADIWNGENGFLNQHLFKVIPNVSYSREYVLQSILNVLTEFRAMANGSTMQHIQRSKLSEVEILNPSPIIMVKYAHISEPIRLQILTISQKLLKIKNLKKILLPRLISGQIEINA